MKNSSSTNYRLTLPEWKNEDLKSKTRSLILQANGGIINSFYSSDVRYAIRFSIPVSQRELLLSWWVMNFSFLLRPISVRISQIWFKLLFRPVPKSYEICTTAGELHITSHRSTVRSQGRMRSASFAHFIGQLIKKKQRFRF